MRIPAMVDLKRTPEEKMEDCMPCPSSASDYPYGLSISFDGVTLEKLNLENEDIQPGDLIHFHAMAMVTSVSKNSSVNREADSHRVELQITHVAGLEDEADEGEEAEQSMSSKINKLYT